MAVKIRIVKYRFTFLRVMKKGINVSLSFIICTASWARIVSLTRMKMILDRGITQQKIRPFILVIASHYTIYEGSFYSNSSLTGNCLTSQPKSW